MADQLRVAPIQLNSGTEKAENIEIAERLVARAASTGADLFICECNHFEKTSGHHLDYETLMQHRAELGCRRLAPTHMSDEMLEQIHNLDTEGAADGKSYVL